MDIRKVKKLIELLEESNVGEIEIKEGEESVRVTKSASALPIVSSTESTSSLNVQQDLNVQQQPQSKIEDDGLAIKAPMVGTFYSAPSPSICSGR